VKKQHKLCAQIQPGLIADVKNCCSNNGILCIESICEAEHQAAWLNQNGFVDGMSSEDGDAPISGASTIVSLVQWSARELSTATCCICHAKEVWQCKSASSSHSSDILLELSCFCGDDQVDSLEGVGTVRGGKHLNECINLPSDSDRVGCLKHLEATKFWMKESEKAG